MVFDQSFVIAGVVASALGSGVPTLCRSMLVSHLREKNLGMLFSVLAIGEVAGFLCCTVAMGARFDVALTSWIGYPFVLITILAAGIFVASWMAGTSSKERASSEQTIANSEPNEKLDNS
jgi:MFS-type transporter involved in bile tolerance (Atg22 family)